MRNLKYCRQAISSETTLPGSLSANVTTAPTAGTLDFPGEAVEYFFQVSCQLFKILFKSPPGFLKTGSRLVKFSGILKNHEDYVGILKNLEKSSKISRRSLTRVASERSKCGCVFEKSSQYFAKKY